MRTILTCLTSITLLLCQKSEAASAPAYSSLSYLFSDSGAVAKPTLKTIVFAPHKKAGLIKKIQLKLLQKGFKYFAKHAADDTTPKKNHLSTVSLILGILALIFILVPSAVGVVAIVAAPAALVTGIIALGKHYNNNKASRTKAIIGIVLGSVIVFLLLLYAMFIAMFGWLL